MFGNKLIKAINKALEDERPEVQFAVRGLQLTTAVQARLVIDGVKARMLLLELIAQTEDSGELAEAVSAANAHTLAEYIIRGASLALAAAKNPAN